jgi:hypothetical protein
MKKTITLLAGAAALLALMPLNSCEKLKDELFKAFSANSGSVNFSIPIITDVTRQVKAGEVVQQYNIDSIIKAETNGTFGIDDIDRIIVEEVKVKVNNPDNDNNLANFEDGMVTLSSSMNPTPLTLATGPIADVYADEKVLPAVSGTDIKGYLKSNMLTYTYNAKLRRPTTKALDCTLNVKFRIE